MDDKHVVCECHRRVEEGAPADLSKCPWCGAVPNTDVIQTSVYGEWLCGSYMHGSRPDQSDACRIRALEAQVLVAGLAETDLKGAVADLKAEVATLRGLQEPLAKQRLQAARERIAGLEAAVAAREARCAVYVRAIREVSGALDTGGETDTALKELLDMALATPDLAASRLLAAGTVVDAASWVICGGKPWYWLEELAAFLNEQGKATWADRVSGIGEALVAHRESVAAEERTDGQ